MTYVHLYANPSLVLWTRLLAYAIDHDGEELERGELRDALDPQRLIRSSEISRAIRTCIKAGALTPESSAAQLFVVNDEEQAE